VLKNLVNDPLLTAAGKECHSSRFSRLALSEASSATINNPKINSSHIV
jgi:hypothetical protein